MLTLFRRSIYTRHIYIITSPHSPSLKNFAVSRMLSFSSILVHIPKDHTPSVKFHFVFNYSMVMEYQIFFEWR